MKKAVNVIGLSIILALASFAGVQASTQYTPVLQRIAALNHASIYGVPNGTSVKMSLSTSSASSGSLTAGMYRFVLDTAGYCKFGGAGTTTDSMYWPANAPEAYRLTGTTTFQCILASGTGTATVTALTEPTDSP
jgi:hypothetical protein